MIWQLFFQNNQDELVQAMAFIHFQLLWLLAIICY